MDERKTIKTGLPRQLSEELDTVAPKLFTIGDARYRLERVVGRGALFVTFRATRIDDEGAVPHAVKVLRPSLMRAWPSGARVLSRDQARVLSILNERVPPSPHVVRLFEIGELPLEGLSVPFFALEWIEDDAPSLFDRVRRSVADHGVALDAISAFHVLEDVARGLDWVHQHGLLHRGIGPTNVLVTGHGANLTAKVSDVAIARPMNLPTSFGLASEIVARSSEPYRAPEQHTSPAEGAAMTPACDVFALGALTRFVLTGAPPRAGRLRENGALHPTFSGSAVHSLEAAASTLSSFDPDDRPQTIESAWALLEPPLRALAARAPDAFGALPLESPSSWVWTERHRPASARNFRAIAVDRDGHALAGGSELAYFDGRTHRPPEPCTELSEVTAVACIATGAFLVGGNNARGAARLFRLDVDGWTRLPVDASGTVAAVLADGDDWRAVIRAGRDLSLVDVRGRVALPGLRTVTALFSLQGVLLVSGIGGTFTFDPESRVARPHPLPLRAITAAASGRREAFAAGEQGALLSITPVHGAPHRTLIAREQIPGDATALSLGHEGSLFVAVAVSGGTELLIREGPSHYRSLLREPGASCIALAPRRNGLLAYLCDGRVLEGRALGA
jgi:serine/threonine protein kinase